MTDEYFHSWLSDKEPRTPDGWGLDAVRGERLGECNACGKDLRFRDQYLYNYRKGETILLHNLKSCWEKYVDLDQINWELEQERKREKS